MKLAVKINKQKPIDNCIEFLLANYHILLPAPFFSRSLFSRVKSTTEFILNIFCKKLSLLTPIYTDNPRIIFIKI